LPVKKLGVYEYYNIHIMDVWQAPRFLNLYILKEKLPDVYLGSFRTFTTFEWFMIYCPVNV